MPCQAEGPTTSPSHDHKASKQALEGGAPETASKVLAPNQTNGSAHIAGAQNTLSQGGFAAIVKQAVESAMKIESPSSTTGSSISMKGSGPVACKTMAGRLPCDVSLSFSAFSYLTLSLPPTQAP